MSETVAELAPTNENSRIQALDVIRGFALIGIFLMNIEFFNRPMSDFTGLPPNLTGWNWIAGLFVYVFVQGKFWTLFSLLFGIGFSVMLSRAQAAGRDFITLYVRRLFGLALFGALHFILLWNGDILFSYAVAAFALLIMLNKKWQWWLGAFALSAIISLATKNDTASELTGALLALGLFLVACRVFLFNEKVVQIGSKQIPRVAVATGAGAVLMAIIAAAFQFAPALQKQSEHAFDVFFMGVIFASLAGISVWSRKSAELRLPRVALSLYLMPMLIMAITGAAHWLSPEPASKSAPVEQTSANTSEAPNADSTKKKADTKQDKAPKTPEQQRLEWQQTRTKNIAEERALSVGTSYVDMVSYRIKKFPKKLGEDMGFTFLLMGVFLFGHWLVQSGKIANHAAHKEFFKKWALYGIPIGVGLGMLGSWITTGDYNHLPRGQSQTADGLAMLGNLPASIGYLSAIILMLNSGTWLSKIKILAPAGRMALSNYLLQSALCTYIFYGYGLGNYGLERAWQVVYVAVFFSLQVLFSHLWLRHFNYGPCEWLWRAITYWQIPVMRRHA